MVAFGQSNCIQQNYCNRAKWLCSGKSGFIRAKVVVLRQKWLNSGKLVVFWQSGCIRAKVVEFMQK